ncbi:MAG: hypothetical protein R3D83_07165 [Caenibius sp.]
MVNAAATAFQHRLAAEARRLGVSWRLALPRRRMTRWPDGGSTPALAAGFHGQMDWMETRADVRQTTERCGPKRAA